MPAPRNYRRDAKDIAPDWPKDSRMAFTKIVMGPSSAFIGPGPVLDAGYALDGKHPPLQAYVEAFIDIRNYEATL